MLHDNLFLILILLFVVTMLAMVSEKLKLSYPVFMVIAGLVIGFIPAMPSFVLQPDIVFLLFLPPLLYAAAWNTSWQDFKKMRRPISMLAFGLVIFTSVAVAFVSNAIIPDFPLAYGFLLGGIISPPDAIAATSVLEGLKVPKRVVTILEGESLINDATSLIVFRFALLAIVSGQFSFVHAGGKFLMVAGLGIVIGLVLGFLFYLIHRFLPTTPGIDTALSLLTPYIIYLVAEHFDCSGVMAVVTAGLLLSSRSHHALSYSSRMQSGYVWDMLVFLLTGFVFILIGLQLPNIIEGLGDVSLLIASFYAFVICVLTVVIRIIWVFPGAYLPRILSKHVRNTETLPPANSVFLVAWSGMRGVVSLASAFAVPLTLGDEQAFPHRNLLLFITFAVILFTLVLQGLSLPWVIRKLKIEDEESNGDEQRVEIKKRLAEAALTHLNENFQDEIESIKAYTRLQERFMRTISIADKKLDNEEGANLQSEFLPRYREMLLELLQVRRKMLNTFYKETSYSHELLRTKEWELDLEEARLNEQN